MGKNAVCFFNHLSSPNSELKPFSVRLSCIIKNFCKVFYEVLFFEINLDKEFVNLHEDIFVFL